jgi:hypothetical protein
MGSLNLAGWSLLIGQALLPLVLMVFHRVRHLVLAVLRHLSNFVSGKMTSQGTLEV